MNKLAKNVPLIIIDVQEAFSNPKWGKRNNPKAEENIERLLTQWRLTERPVIFVQHISSHPEGLFKIEDGSAEMIPSLRPKEGEWVIQKSVNSAFIGTNLEEILREMEAPNVVIVGLTTNHCVETTTRMAGNMKFSPYLVSDAAATFDRIGPDGKLYAAEAIHKMTMANLHDEFATIITTNEILQLL
jgi:nicotinamidase-related amidase